MLDGGGPPRREMISVSVDQDLIKELSNFMVVAFEVFLSAVDGGLRAKTTAHVGLRMANSGVDKFIVRDTIPTMSEDLGFTDQAVLRNLAAHALYTDKSCEFKVVGSRASVNFTHKVKPADGGKEQDLMAEEQSRRIKESEAKLGEQDKEKVRPNLSKEAVEMLLAEEGVPKWMEKLGSVLVPLFKKPFSGTNHFGLVKGFLLKNPMFWLILWLQIAANCCQLDIQDYFGHEGGVYHGWKCLWSLFEPYCIMHGKILSGHFWYTSCWVPDPLSPLKHTPGCAPCPGTVPAASKPCPTHATVPHAPTGPLPTYLPRGRRCSISRTQAGGSSPGRPTRTSTTASSTTCSGSSRTSRVTT